MSGDKPQKSFLNFLKYLKKESRKNGTDFSLSGLRVLDLGSGNGKNSVYLAEKGAKVDGIEFSQSGIDLAEQLKIQKDSAVKISGGRADFIKGSIGEKFYFPDNSFDIVLDITSSNSLTESERNIYLSESQRVLKKGGYFFARGLLKDGDKNAKYLLKNFPANENDMYTIPDFGLTERVFSKEDLLKTYREFFDILKFDKETHYTTYGYKKYKRNFWILYLEKQLP